MSALRATKISTIIRSASNDDMSAGPRNASAIPAAAASTAAATVTQVIRVDPACLMTDTFSSPVPTAKPSKRPAKL